MSRPQIENISHMHDQIMNWLIANPEKLLRECAAHFQITQAWLSCIIHSDVFQAKFKERQEYVFQTVAHGVPAKLQAAADMVTDQLMQALEKNQDKDFTLDAFDKILHRAGYAPASARNPGAGGNVNVTNNILVDKDLLAAARASMGVKGPQPNVIEHVAPEDASPLKEPLPLAAPPREENSEADKLIWEVLNIPAPEVVHAAPATTE